MTSAWIPFSPKSILHEPTGDQSVRGEPILAAAAPRTPISEPPSYSLHPLCCNRQRAIAKCSEPLPTGPTSITEPRHLSGLPSSSRLRSPSVPASMTPSGVFPVKFMEGLTRAKEYIALTRGILCGYSGVLSAKYSFTTMGAPVPLSYHP